MSQDQSTTVIVSDVVLWSWSCSGPVTPGQEDDRFLVCLLLMAAMKFRVCDVCVVEHVDSMSRSRIFTSLINIPTPRDSCAMFESDVCTKEFVEEVSCRI